MITSFSSLSIGSVLHDDPFERSPCTDSSLRSIPLSLFSLFAPALNIDELSSSATAARERERESERKREHVCRYDVLDEYQLCYPCALILADNARR